MAPLERRDGGLHDRRLIAEELHGLVAPDPAASGGGGQFHHLPGAEGLLDKAAVAPDLGVLDEPDLHQTISATDARSWSDATPTFGNTPKATAAMSEVAASGELVSPIVTDSFA